MQTVQCSGKSTTYPTYDQIQKSALITQRAIFYFRLLHKMRVYWFIKNDDVPLRWSLSTKTVFNACLPAVMSRSPFKLHPLEKSYENIAKSVILIHIFLIQSDETFALKNSFHLLKWGGLLHFMDKFQPFSSIGIVFAYRKHLFLCKNNQI